ncbi:hypothetical protein BDF19DRAFT_438983 [Syncephalis fuscata]|nr:hypothetical protein BDF19DRAFT_438983 [Syncephalis fuscata]
MPFWLVDYILSFFRPAMANTKTRIVVVGGAYAGIAVLSALANTSKKLNLKLTLVEPRDHFHQNMAFVRAATQKGFAEKCFVPMENAAFFKDGTVKHERARVSKALSDRVVLDDGREIAFDYLVLATGSRFGVPGRPAGDSVEEVTQKLTAAREAVEKARRILIVGGGPVGIELAGEIKDLPNKEVTLVSNGLLSGMPAVSDKLRHKLSSKMKARDIKVIDQQRVTVTAEEREIGYVAETRGWKLSNGETIEADLMFACTAHTGLNTTLARSLGDDVVNLETEEIRIRPTTQLLAHSNIFAIGDCNDDGHKTAYAARLQADVASKNIIKLVEAKGAGNSSSNSVKLTEFKAPNVCLVTIGAHEGAAQLPVFGVVGRTLPAMLKGKDFMLKSTYKQFNATAPTF